MPRKNPSPKRRSGCPLNASVEVLADRRQKLIAHGIITNGPDPSDGRKLIYSLTPKGIDLAPVLTEMVLWAAAHEDTGNQALVREMRKDKEQFISAIRKRWAEAIRAADRNPPGKLRPSRDARRAGPVSA